MSYVRQHYNLATSGQLGQKCGSKGAPRGATSKGSDGGMRGKTMKSGGYSGSYRSSAKTPA